MIVDWPREFNQQLDRLETDQSEHGKRIYDLVVAALTVLENLDAEPVDDAVVLKRVRQSGKHLVWRISHPYEAGIAVRLICWFPPHSDHVVVALFSGEKASMGDVFYDSVGVRADQLIDRWLAETDGEKS